MKIEIRTEKTADYQVVEKLTYDAFETMQISGRTHTDEHFLVSLLRNDPDFIPQLDLIAENKGEIVGNIMYSRSSVIRPDRSQTTALVFGPLSVKPEFHGKGIGSLLIEKSLETAKELGYGAVLITGHVDYYKRFGFVPASQYAIVMPDGASFDAFMALELIPDYLGKTGGKWKLCKAFDACGDAAAFEIYQKNFNITE